MINGACSKCPKCGDWKAFDVPCLPVVLMHKGHLTWRLREFKLFMCRKCGQAFGYDESYGDIIKENP